MRLSKLQLLLQSLDCAFEFDSKLFDLADTNVLSFVASVKTAFNVHIVVFDDTKDNF